MNRRAFLASLAAAIAAPAVDPEKLLWTPGAKLISIPKPAPMAWPPAFSPAPLLFHSISLRFEEIVWVTLATPEEVAAYNQQSLDRAANKLGDTVTVRRPLRFVGGTH